MKVVILKRGHGKLIPNKEGKPIQVSDEKGLMLIGCGVAERFPKPKKAVLKVEDKEDK